MLIVSSVVEIKHRELHPSREISRAHFNSSLEIVSIVLSPAYNSKNKMSLSQVFALETFAHLVNNGHENEE